jgi:tRNA A-37 threonylcarbamoyl transferase component Bud32
VLKEASTIPRFDLVPPVSAPSAEEIAAHFPELELLERIGAGGMGAVYKARQPKLDRIVALKVLRRELADQPGFLDRFHREARLLARLHHANIVTLFDTGTSGPYAFLLMEYVDGVNLHQAMQAGRFTPFESLRLVEEICAGLHFAHGRGILHRDIKPENLLIDSHGQVKIADFGIAKIVGEGECGHPTLTQTGMAVGTPRYMAPEQLESPQDVDHRADIYSLGVVLYELLTGKLPVGRFALPSSGTEMDPRIDGLVMRALEREREDRFQDMGELKVRVGEILRSRQNPASPTAIPLAAHAAVCTGTSVALALVSLAFIMMKLELIRSNAAGAGVIYLVLAFQLILIGIPGVVGILFGGRVLAELRKSRGEWPGLDTALIAVLPWPLLVVFAMVGTLLWEAFRALGFLDPSIPLFVVLSLLIGALPAAAIIRLVLRWVMNGTSASPGDRR